MDVREALRTSFAWHMVVIAAGVGAAAAAASGAVLLVKGKRTKRTPGEMIMSDARFWGAFMTSLATVAVVLVLVLAGPLCMPSHLVPVAFIGAAVGASVSVGVLAVGAMYQGTFPGGAPVGTPSAADTLHRVSAHGILATACALATMMVI